MSYLSNGPAVRSRDPQAEEVSSDAIDLLGGFVQEVIKACRKGDSRAGKRMCLYTRDGKRLLGRHRDKASAARQEKAIKS